MAITDRHLQALGRITVNFANLEFTLSALLVGIITPDQAIGQIVASQLSFSRLINVIDATFRHRAGDGSDTKRLQALLRRASDAEANRNIMVHSAYLVAEGGPPNAVTRMKVKTRRDKGLSHDAKETTPEELDSVADEIHTVASDITAFMAELTKRHPNKP